MQRSHRYDSHDRKARYHPPTCLSVRPEGSWCHSLNFRLALERDRDRERERESCCLLILLLLLHPIQTDHHPQGTANCEREEDTVRKLDGKNRVCQGKRWVEQQEIRMHPASWRRRGWGGAETSLAVVEVLTVWLLGTEAFRLALILLGCG